MGYRNVGVRVLPALSEGDNVIQVPRGDIGVLLTDVADAAVSLPNDNAVHLLHEGLHLPCPAGGAVVAGLVRIGR